MSATFGCLFYRGQTFGDQKLRRELSHRQVAVADDHTEKIVKVMRNAPCETAYGLHLVRLLGLHLQAFHFSGVLRDREHTDLPKKLNLFGRHSCFSHYPCTSSN